MADDLLNTSLVVQTVLPSPYKVQERKDKHVALRLESPIPSSLATAGRHTVDQLRGKTILMMATSV